MSKQPSPHADALRAFREAKVERVAQAAKAQKPKAKRAKPTAMHKNA